MTVKKIMVYGIVILAMCFWSMTFIWYKIVFEALTPITVMTFRLSISSVILLAFSILIGKLQIPEKSDIKWFLLLSIFQPFLYFLAESYGVSLVSSTVSALIISTIPVFTPLVAYFFLREKINPINIVGIIISFIGILMVVLGKNLHFSGSKLGILFLCGAVISALGYAVIIVRLAIKYNSFTIISWQNMLGALLFLLLFFIIDFQNFKKVNFTQVIVANLMYLALFGSTLSYIFFTYSIKQLGISKASLFINTIPLFTAVFAYYLLNEHLTWFKIAGIFIVIFGLILGQFFRTKKQQPNN